MIKYYALFDKSLQLSNPPFSAADDKTAIRLCRDMLLGTDDSVVKRVLPLCDLRFIGTYDETTCVFSAPSVPNVICDISTIPLPDSSGGTV